MTRPALSFTHESFYVTGGTLEGDAMVLKVTVKNEDGGTVNWVLKGTVNGAEIKGVAEAEVDGEKVRLNWSAKKA